MDNKYNDKIFYNRYNIGDCYNTDYTESSLDNIFDMSITEGSSPIYDIQNLIEYYFRQTSLYNTLYNKKKIPKKYINELFLEIFNKFDHYKYSTIDIVISFCEYFQLSYKNLYDEIPIEYKKRIIIYLDKKTEYVDCILKNELIF